MNINLMTPREVAAAVKVSQATVCRMIHSKELPSIAFRSGKHTTYRVRTLDLEEYLNARASNSTSTVRISRDRKRG